MIWLTGDERIVPRRARPTTRMACMMREPTRERPTHNRSDIMGLLDNVFGKDDENKKSA